MKKYACFLLEYAMKYQYASLHKVITDAPPTSVFFFLLTFVYDLNQ